MASAATRHLGAWRVPKVVLREFAKRVPLVLIQSGPRERIFDSPAEVAADRAISTGDEHDGEAGKRSTLTQGHAASERRRRGHDGPHRFWFRGSAWLRVRRRRRRREPLPR